MAPNELHDLKSRNVDLGPLFNVPRADETKREAFGALKDKLPEMEAKVLDVLRSGEKTNKEIARVLGFGDAANLVTRQVMNLRNYKPPRVVMAGKKKDPATGRTVQIWRAV